MHRLNDSAGYFGFKIKQFVIDERLEEIKQEQTAQETKISESSDKNTS